MNEEKLSEILGNLSQHKLAKLRKVSTKLLAKKQKRSKKTKYGNINKGFTDDELERFLKACNHPKAHLAFYLMSHLGLRVSEAVRVKADDIDWHSKKIRISTLKANTGDFLYMSIGVQKLLLAWVRKYENEIAEHGGYILFSSNPRDQRSHISANWLRSEFREVCLLANLNEWYDYSDESTTSKHQKRKLHRLSTHSLRHYFITKCYNHCKNPMLTQKLARHTSFKSTETYINVDFEKLGRIVEDVFGAEESIEKDEILNVIRHYFEVKNSQSIR